jgi:oligopeptide/dipeptide ABC transporter ATP-binding protein
VSEATLDRSASAGSPSGEPLLRVTGLTKHYPIRLGVIRQKVIGQVKAVDGVDLEIYPRETVGLVGESGCGKSTVTRVLMALEKPTAGHVYYRGDDIFGMSKGDLRALRRQIQIIFQDPYTSLNPRMTVGDIVGEPWEIHPEVLPKKGRSAAVKDLLARVGLNPDFVNRYPHQFSGGQRQRIGIARALALNPEIIVCDEPVSALDVSVQAQVINLLQDLQRDRGLTYLFIAHDLSVVEHIATRVAVMYLGKVVELASAEALYAEPLMPYTQALLSAVPVPDPTATKRRIVLTGDVPSPANPPSGCVFHPRCHHPQRDAACAAIAPPLEEKAPGHWVACIKQLPTAVDWGAQQAAGATKRPERYLPVAAVHPGAP